METGEIVLAVLIFLFFGVPGILCFIFDKK